MARICPYRREISDACSWHQDEALNSEMYILYNTGPTGFLLKEEGENKNFKVFLGDIHNCTCSVFKKEKDLCKHICWLLLKKFRVPRTNPLSWQLGLCEREINEILRGVTVKENSTRNIVKKTTQEQSVNSEQGGIKQRTINAEDICPICQDDFLVKKLPVTYCKFGCGNNVHIKCMKIWADHQKSNGETQLKCPLCREKFSTFELLEEEFRNNGLFKSEKLSIHHGLSCKSCNSNPISGKCYMCMVCKEFYLCQACFNTDFHNEHNFLFREKENMKFRKASREHVGCMLPQAVANSLLRRELSEQDYDILLQLDQRNGATNGNLSRIPEKVIKSWPNERIRENHKLLNPGYQCRVCLRNYEVGQVVRRLPHCKHKFHADCIDNWLLHSHPTCPIDGTIAWSPEIEEKAKNEVKTKSKQDIPVKSNTEALNLEVSSIGLLVNYKSASTLKNNNVSHLMSTSLHNRHNNSKILKNRAMTTNQIKNGPVLEVKGQNVAQNNLIQRHNSISLDDQFNNENINLMDRTMLLPKINRNKPLKQNHHETHNESESQAMRLQYDVFNMALVGTKPYQLSRTQNNQDINAAAAKQYQDDFEDYYDNRSTLTADSEYNTYNNNNYRSTSPPLLHINSNEAYRNLLDDVANRTDLFYFDEQQNHMLLLGNTNNNLPGARNQIIFQPEYDTNSIGISRNGGTKANSTQKKLGLRIHHPKPKLNNLNNLKNPKQLMNKQNNSSDLNSFQLVAVPAMKIDDNLNERINNYDLTNDFYLDTTNSDLE